MQQWIYKTNEAGAPRRFLSHREAAWWAMIEVLKFAAPRVWPLILGPIILSFAPNLFPGPTSAARLVAGLAVGATLALWLGVSGVIYLYIALSGGVMDAVDRRKYLQGEGNVGPRTHPGG